MSKPTGGPTGTDLYSRLNAAAHAIVGDTEGEHPFTDALEAILQLHEPHDPPGPVPGPIRGVCASCGNTGVIHGPGANGNWTDDPCGCAESFCGECRQIEPCGTKVALAEALGVRVDIEDGHATDWGAADGPDGAPRRRDRAEVAERDEWLCRLEAEQVATGDDR